MPSIRLLLLCGVPMLAGCGSEPRAALSDMVGRTCMIQYEGGNAGEQHPQGTIRQVSADWILLSSETGGFLTAIPTKRVIEINFNLADLKKSVSD